MRARSVFAVIVTVVAARAVAACVDGVTPDCSVESVCAPIEGDAAQNAVVTDSATTEAGTPDASRDTASPTDSGADAEGG